MCVRYPRRVTDAVHPDLAESLALAVDSAHEAGALVRARRREGVTVAATKSSVVDVVTQADRDSEDLIRARLLAARPDDGFYGEEGGAAASVSGRSWVVDPIDGTVNYLYGHPQYAISIALVEGDPSSEPAAYRTLLGVVHNPAAGLTYTATEGGGAWLQGERLRVNPVTDLEQALVATGFAYDAGRRREQAQAWAQLAERVRDLRRNGAASLDLCAVAAGLLDAYYESGTHPWDHAAGVLIAREAGAVVHGVAGRREGRALVLAAAPGIAAELARVLPASAAVRIDPGPVH